MFGVLIAIKPARAFLEYAVREFGGWLVGLTTPCLYAMKVKQSLVDRNFTASSRRPLTICTLCMRVLCAVRCALCAVAVRCVLCAVCSGQAGKWVLRIILRKLYRLVKYPSLSQVCCRTSPHPDFLWRVPVTAKHAIGPRPFTRAGARRHKDRREMRMPTH